MCAPIGLAEAQVGGDWTGTTGQGHPFEITVSGSGISRIYYKGTLSGCVTVTTTITTPVPISGQQFAYNSPGYCLSQELSGTFQSATSATGTLKLIFSSGFGCPCVGTVETSWTATAPGAPPPPPPHTLTIATGPSGSPNPVPQGGQVDVSVGANDSLGHDLSYGWSAACPTLSSNGTFSNAGSVSPTWTAPDNPTGSTQACDLSVTVNDNHGLSQSKSYTQLVDSIPHTLTITHGPEGAPNPAKPGTPITESVAATDTLGHALTYLWTALCPGLPSNGSFSDGHTASPQWTTPFNTTGSSKSCTVGVTVSDGHGLSQSSTYAHAVESAPHLLSVPLGPISTVNPVGSAGSTALTVSATDSIGHGLTYIWVASCPNLPSAGSFSDATSRIPMWTAPENTTGNQQSCTLSVTANDGHGLSRTMTVTQAVATQGPCAYTVSSTPAVAPPAGTTGTIVVSTEGTCAWSATSQAPWIEIASGTAGTGDGSVSIVIDAADAFGTRSGSVTVGDSTVVITQQGLGYTHYFAEGATINRFFETRFALLNTDASNAASVSLQFQLKDTATVLTHSRTVAAGARDSVDVSTLAAADSTLAALASAEFSTVVASDVPVVADRTMTWDRAGYGSHAEASVPAAATRSGISSCTISSRIRIRTP